jgi:hypothetical protein
MITENTLIYSLEEKELFCILLDRRYSLGVIGFSKPVFANIINELNIKDIADYLNLSFGGRELPGNFKNTLFKNWNSDSTSYAH